MVISVLFQGKSFKLILQTRIDPTRCQVVKTGRAAPHDEYWIMTDDSAIRPYGLCCYETVGLTNWRGLDSPFH